MAVQGFQELLDSTRTKPRFQDQEEVTDFCPPIDAPNVTRTVSSWVRTRDFTDSSVFQATFKWFQIAHLDTKLDSFAVTTNIAFTFE